MIKCAENKTHRSIKNLNRDSTDQTTESSFKFIWD